MRDVPIEAPPVDDLGPAMLALTEQQRRFVVGWIQTRGKNGARVARAAGYSDASEACKVKAHYLLRSAKVIAALKEEAGRRMETLPILAVMAMEDQLGHRNPRIRKDAAVAVLDRTGYGVQVKHEVKIEVADTRSLAEIMREMDEYRRLLLSDQSQTVETTYSEVKDEKAQAEA